jgi:hypothetical protein
MSRFELPWGVDALHRRDETRSAALAVLGAIRQAADEESGMSSSNGASNPRAATAAGLSGNRQHRTAVPGGSRTPKRLRDKEFLLVWHAFSNPVLALLHAFRTVGDSAPVRCGAHRPG